MAMLELAASTYLECSRLVVCLGRANDAAANQTLLRNLGWVGFELTTMEPWTGVRETSDEWWVLGMIL